MKKILVLSLIFGFFMTSLLFGQPAEETKSKKPYKMNHIFSVAFAYYPGHHKGLGSTGFSPTNYDRLDYKKLAARYPAIDAEADGARNDLGLAMSIELKAYYTFQMEFPAMRANNAMMKGNNIKFKTRANISPVSFEVGPYLELTPIAFLVFEFGSKIGTGWDFSPLNLNGLAINDPTFRFTDNQKAFDATSGVLSTTKMQAKLQFDVGALIPGDWTHFVVVAIQNVEYQYFSGANNNQYWRWEHDAGENQNGFVWYQTYVVGYQMPTAPGYLDMVGMLIETEQKLTGKDDSTMDSGGWGSDFISCAFGPLFNFKFNEHHSLAVIFQFKTARQYTDATMAHRYFEHRSVNTGSPTYVYFDRFALSYTMTY